MAQSAGVTGRKNPLEVVSFWPEKHTEFPMLWQFWLNRFQWGMVAKHSINPKKLLFRGLVDGYADSGVTGGGGRKKQVSGRTNPNFDPIPLLRGKGPIGVAQAKTTFGVGRGTLPEGARFYGGGV